MKHSLFFCLCSLFFYSVEAQQLAFPGAEGWGAYSRGGRGGAVYHVTTLNDSGPGSLRDAVGTPGRTVVFDISGVIRSTKRIPVSSDITIAGQTAPGEGIVIYGNGVSCSNIHDVIIRYIRFRGGMHMSKGSCSLIADHSENIMIDHCSIEWGRWDNLHIKESKKITVQYCLDGEGIDPQRFGALLEGPEMLTIHHCLWLDNKSRNPKAKAGIQFINNVIYNCQNGLVGGHSKADHYQDVIGNYFISGPVSGKDFIAMFTATDHVYQKGNYVDLNKDGTLNGVEIPDSSFANIGATMMKEPHQPSPVPVNLQTAEDAYKTVIQEAGVSLVRDATDSRLVTYVESLGSRGMFIKNEGEVEGQKDIPAAVALPDTDKDGMPDSWEIANHLNPNDPSDNKKLFENSEYTNLEIYLNGLLKNKIL